MLVYGPQSISDDDLCSGCHWLDYKPGELSTCSMSAPDIPWPGDFDDDGYVVTCVSFTKRNRCDESWAHITPAAGQLRMKCWGCGADVEIEPYEHKLYGTSYKLAEHEVKDD